LPGPDKLPGEVAFPDIVDWRDGLSEEEAVTLGLWNSPSYQELLADLQITRADLIEAHQIKNPEIATMFPVSVKQWEFVLNVPLDALLLRPGRMAAAQLESQRVAERLVQDGLNLIRDLRTAYVDLALAQQQLELAEWGRQLHGDIARVAEARQQAGDLSELDIAPLRLDASISSERVVQASRDMDLARENLRFLMGVEMTDAEISATPLADVPDTEFDVDQLVAEALASRPDLRALEMASAAASRRAQLARYDYFNIWGALPDINGKGKRGFEAGPGLLFSLPVFHQNQGAIARAQAEFERRQRQLAKQQQMVALEVRLAHTRLVKSRQDLRIWRKQVLPQAEAAVQSASEAMYEDGVSLFSVLESTRQLLYARRQELQALADMRRALADLERSVGRCLGDELACVDAAKDMALPEPDGRAELLVPPEPDDDAPEQMPPEPDDVVEEMMP
jgi:cobalt-zinc-cadmium efflux system outer membrane protein